MSNKRFNWELDKNWEFWVIGEGEKILGEGGRDLKNFDGEGWWG